MKPFSRRCLPFLIGGMALTLALYFTLFQSRSFFAGLSDGCFASGIVLVLISLVCFVSASGLFDRAGYSFYSFCRIFKRNDAKPATFEEYIQKHKGLKRNWAPAACGLVYLILSIVLGSLC